MVCGVVVLFGCGADEAAGPSNDAAGVASGVPVAVTADDDEFEGPTILGVDSELQREMRILLTQFIELRQIPGDAAENLNKAFESAMQRVRRPADELGIDPDAAGNIDWPKDFEQEMVNPLRAEFDAKTLFDTHEIDLPEWAQPLLDEYRADQISPVRKELLFRLASGEVIKDMT
jgi:hypothetical protein